MTGGEGTRFVVTGGAGFVGASLVAALLRRFEGCDITIVDDFRTGSFANVVEACERGGLAPFSGRVLRGPFWEVDWDELLVRGKVTAVFHEAAITDTTVDDEAEMLRVNAEASEQLMRDCAQRGVALVYASSAATYGTPPEARDRRPFPLGAAGRPSNVYGFSKWVMECNHRRVAAEFEDRHGKPVRIVGLRYFNVFGPGEARKGKMASMVYQLARRLLDGARPRLFTDGRQARDQVYVDDVVDCTIAAAGLGQGKGPMPGVYNVGSGVATSFNDIVAALRRGLGVLEGGLETEYFDMPESVRAFYQDWTCADLTETQRGLGWTARWKPAEAIAHYAKVLKAGRGPSAR